MNASVRGTISDRYGAYGTSAAVAVNVTAMNGAQLITALHQMITSMGSGASVNATVLRTSLLLAAGIMRHQSIKQCKSVPCILCTYGDSQHHASLIRGRACHCRTVRRLLTAPRLLLLLRLCRGGCNGSVQHCDNGSGVRSLDRRDHSQRVWTK
jgi:hypothetical protein